MDMQAMEMRTTTGAAGAYRPGGLTMERPRNLLEAAEQFEGMLIGEMMKTLRESSGGGWLGCGGDESGEALTGFAEEHLSRTIAEQGGFGLAKMIAMQLSGGPGSAGRDDQAIKASSSEESPADEDLRALAQASHP